MRFPVGTSIFYTSRPSQPPIHRGDPLLAANVQRPASNMMAHAKA